LIACLLLLDLNFIIYGACSDVLQRRSTRRWETTAQRMAPSADEIKASLSDPDRVSYGRTSPLKKLNEGWPTLFLVCLMKMVSLLLVSRCSIGSKLDTVERSPNIRHDLAKSMDNSLRNVGLRKPIEFKHTPLK